VETNKLGLPALPIHDAVICKASDKATVKQAMEFASREVLGVSLTVVEK
jgi:hypothetical protein